MKKFLLISMMLLVSFVDVSLTNIEAQSSFVVNDLMAFIEEFDIDVPNDYLENEKLDHLVQILVDDSFRYPKDYYPYNYTELVNLAKSIRTALYDNHVIIDQNIGIGQIQTVRASSSLNDSILISPWNSSLLDYNCYGHAISNTAYYVNPGYYSGQSFNINYSISDMASLVIDDLEVLGYWAYQLSYKPSLLVNGEMLIAIRKTNSNQDYHFFRGVTPTHWAHKPGGTQLLKFNYAYPDYKDWTNEAIFMNQYYPGSLTYDSSLRYILYWPKGTGIEPWSLDQ